MAVTYQGIDQNRRRRSMRLATATGHSRVPIICVGLDASLANSRREVSQVVILTRWRLLALCVCVGGGGGGGRGAVW